MPFLDMLDNPVNIGDTIVYPASAGSSAAQMSKAVVTDILEIFPKTPTDPNCREGFTRTGTKIDQTPRRLWRNRVEGSRREKKYTYAGREYTRPEWDFEYDQSRLFILRVKRVSEGSDDFDPNPRPGVILKNIDRIVVVTPLMGNS